MITQTFRDIATATRIESIANTMSVISTRTTVLQNALSPRNVATGLSAFDPDSSGRPQKCLIGR